MRERTGYGRFALLLATALLFGICPVCTEAAENTYIIYYEDLSGTSLHEEEYAPKAENFEDLMAELIEKFTETPAEESYRSALPDSVAFQGYERGINDLQMDFSASYYDLDNVEEVLLRAALVKTFGQIPGVTKVMVTVDSEQLVDADGKPVAEMDPDSFIDTKKGGISSYQYAVLDLYFPTRDGEMLQKEVRNIDYSSNMILERVIVEQLIAGASDPSCKTAINPDAELLDVSTKNGICTLNFSEEFNEIPSENAPSAQAALYSVIDSICDTSEEIEGVKFSVEGQSNLLFWDEIDLNTDFPMSDALVRPDTETEASAQGEKGQTEVAAGSDSTLAGAEQ